MYFIIVNILIFYITRKNYQTSLHGDTLIYGGWIPHLTFTFKITTTKFSVHQYTRNYPERKGIRDKVWELHQKGWGYTKIHKLPSFTYVIFITSFKKYITPRNVFKFI